MLLMTNFIKYYRKKAGVTQEALAEAVNTTHPTLQRLESGKIALSKEWAERLAPILNVHPINLMFGNEELIAAQQVSADTAFEVDVSFERLPVVGKVQAGAYSDAAELPPEDWKYVRAPVDDRYPGIKRFCLEVLGESMNLEFAPGSLAICVNMIDLQEDPIDGVVYVVDHTLVHGEVESTLKELRIMPDGRKFLWPKSTAPEHQQPIELNGNAGETIRLRAKVVGSYSVR